MTEPVQASFDFENTYPDVMDALEHIWRLAMLDTEQERNRFGDGLAPNGQPYHFGDRSSTILLGRRHAWTCELARVNPTDLPRFMEQARFGEISGQFKALMDRVNPQTLRLNQEARDRAFRNAQSTQPTRTGVSKGLDKPSVVDKPFNDR